MYVQRKNPRRGYSQMLSATMGYDSGRYWFSSFCLQAFSKFSVMRITALNNEVILMEVITMKRNRFWGHVHASAPNYPLVSRQRNESQGSLSMFPPDPGHLSLPFRLGSEQVPVWFASTQQQRERPEARVPSRILMCQPWDPALMNSRDSPVPLESVQSLPPVTSAQLWVSCLIASQFCPLG